MKILITGITGQLGTALAETLSGEHEIIGLSRDSISPFHTTINADLCDWKAVYDAITRANPDLVVHAAAESNVDACERAPDTAYRVNALGTRAVAAACQRFDAALLYISTDYVFSGYNAPAAGYTEWDVPAPINAYGRSKWQGEEFVRALLNRYYIVRTSWLFGRRRANFVTQIAGALSSGAPYAAAEDMAGAPTLVSDVASAVGELVTTPLYGTYHLSNAGFASRYEIAGFIADRLGVPRAGITKCALKDLRLPAPRPVFSGLRNYLWELSGFTPLRPWQDAVAEFVERNT